MRANSWQLFAQNESERKTKDEIEKMHQDPRAYISMLENPQRDSEQKPEEVLMTLAVRQGRDHCGYWRRLRILGFPFCEASWG
jgi:hypothetical protein